MEGKFIHGIFSWNMVTIKTIYKKSNSVGNGGKLLRSLKKNMCFKEKWSELFSPEA